MNTDILPTVSLGDQQVSRLIIGGNPFRGNSHFSEQMNRDMLEYYTVQRIKHTLFRCERRGINTMQVRGDVLLQAVVREYRAEGGKMHVIFQTASELRDLQGHVRQLARFGALGIYVHGTWTDRHFHDGDMTDVEELLKVIRDTGVQVGLGTHIPEVIDLAEERLWDLDFYMASMYNLSRRPRESALVSGARQSEELFDHTDKFKMLERIRRTKKTCLAFKVLGASRLCASPSQVREAFRIVLSAIKPTDAIVVGMFPKYRDQVAQNARLVRAILEEHRQAGATAPVLGADRMRGE